MAFDRGILCLTFDNMGAAADIGRGLRADPDPHFPDLAVGYPRLLELLRRLDVRASFFIEGWNALHHPASVRRLQDEGHEIGLHGWVHEVFHTLTALKAEQVLRDAQAAFRIIGIDPKGFRAPGGTRGVHTVEILSKLGIEYDSSVEDPAVTMTPRLLLDKIPNVPWQWPMIDYYQYFMHPEGAQSPEQLELLWSAELERAAETRSLVTIIGHAIVTGIEPNRLAALERVLIKAKRDPRLEIMTASQVARMAV